MTSFVSFRQNLNLLFKGSNLSIRRSSIFRLLVQLNVSSSIVMNNSLESFKVVHCSVIKDLSYVRRTYDLRNRYTKYIKCDCSFVVRSSATTLISYHGILYMSTTFLKYFLKKKRSRRDLNPRAGFPTYTLSRGTSSAT